MDRVPEENRVIWSVLQNADAPLTEREIRRSSRKLKEVDIESILRELVDEGTVMKTYHSDGRGQPTFRYEFVRCQSVAVAITLKNTGEKGTNGNGNTVNSPENEFSTLSEYDQFAPPEKEHDSPIPSCQKCVHHRPATYPRGLCGKGYCQQDLSCHGYAEG
jgi:hypothetical protein